MKLPAKVYLKAFVNILLSCTAVLLCIYVLPKIALFFMPFLIGWIVACLAAPMVRFCEEKLKIKRKAGSAFVIVLTLALVILACYGVIYFIVHQITGFASAVPDLWNAAMEEIRAAGVAIQRMMYRFPAELQENINSFFTNLGDYVTEWLSDVKLPAAGTLGNAAKQIPSIIVSIVVTLLSSYFFVADKTNLAAAYEKYCPRMIKYRLRLISTGLKNAIGGYLKAQFKIEVWIYLLLVVGMFILGIPYGALISVGIAFLDFLPIFGTGTVMVPWAVIKLLDGDFKVGIGLLITWGVGQIVRQIIQPKIVGDSVGLPALPTLFLIYVGYRLGGFGGMIIALPVGILLVQLYQEGMFDTTVKSFQILFAGINRFRKIRDEDMLIVHEYQREVKEELDSKKQ